MVHCFILYTGTESDNVFVSTSYSTYTIASCEGPFEYWKMTGNMVFILLILLVFIKTNECVLPN